MALPDHESDSAWTDALEHALERPAGGLFIAIEELVEFVLLVQRLRLLRSNTCARAILFDKSMIRLCGLLLLQERQRPANIRRPVAPVRLAGGRPFSG